ncbi:MAG: trigger factor [Bacteroidales bacterium]|nr:trigger factor [Bacteroidales bacterium]
MNITKENTGDLTAILKVEVIEKDYQEQVVNVLKDYRKKANIPGFRVGKVPPGVIKKMYGKAVIADEVNKVLSESLQKYIEENKLNILGQPLPNVEKSENIDFEKQNDFVFFFDIGMSPEVNLELSDKIKVNYYKIKADKKTVDKYIEDIKKRNGTTIHPDAPETGDTVKGNLVQLDDKGQLMEDDAKNEALINIDFLKDNAIQKKFIKLKKGDKIIFNPLKATENETQTAAILGIKIEDTEKLKSDYEFTLTDIDRIEPAELNEELYKKTFPHAKIENEEQLRKEIKKEAEIVFAPESEKMFMNDAIEKLIETSEILLPDEFMKRWILESNEGKITKEQLEVQYDSYAKSLRWQLVENKIINDHNIKIDNQEIKTHIKKFLTSQMPMPKDDPEADNRMNGIIDSVMENKEEVKKINDQLYDEKLREVFKSTLKLTQKKVTFEEFSKLAQEINK